MTVDYGPLTNLIGTFKGDKGLDIAPDPDGKEENPFYETIVFSEAGYAVNAQEQKLAVLHYHLIVNRKKNDAIIHNQTGYWMYDKAQNQVIQSIAIPRAVCLLAVGAATTDADGTITIDVATEKDGDFGIVQASFMHQKAKTTSFKQTMYIKGNELQYHETTMVDIYSKSFEHTDTNTLKKV